MKFVVIALSIVISLVIGEVALRWLTVFPISRDSNTIEDPRLGYRMSPSFPDVDSYGFRNPDGARESYEVAAIGDSHTYGYHVDAQHSWPVVFGELTGASVYNFGIPSYNMFTYHALVDAALEDGAKAVIIALYLTNDFVRPDLTCAEGSDLDYWHGEILDLGLDMPATPADCSRRGRTADTKSLDRYLSKSAIFSAINHLILKKVTELARKSGVMADFTFFIHNIPYELGIPFGGAAEDQFFRFPGDIFPIMKDRIAVADGREDKLENFSKLVANWRRETDRAGAKLGILIIPSRSQVVYTYFEQQGQLELLDPEFRRIVEGQNAFDSLVESILDELAVPYLEAAPETATEMGEAAIAQRNFYPAMDAHPLEDGYRAYGVAAARLWERLSLQGSTPPLSGIVVPAQRAD